MAPFTAAALANYLRWRRIDGDDKTPIGALKLGEGDGKTQYVSFGQLTGADRGLRGVGMTYSIFRTFGSGSLSGGLRLSAVFSTVAKTPRGLP